MSVEQHRSEGPKEIRCRIITVSDTRTMDTDKSGQLMKDMLQSHGCQLVGYQIVKDDFDQIQEAIREGTNGGTDAVLINGGTGIALRDVTCEAVSGMLDKEMPGFGELFRYLSFVEDIGSAAMLSRAIAGVYCGCAIFSVPGSTGAVRLAMSRLILPELRHTLREIRKDEPPASQ